MIPISYRHFDKHIKSLVHFDFPYYSEPGDGLADEILGLGKWSRSGSAKLSGSESPADEIITGTPCFGWRCLHTTSSSDFVKCSSSVFSLPDSGDFEFSLRLRIPSAVPGNILQLMNSESQVLALSLLSSGHLALTCSAMNLSLTSQTGVPLNQWTLVRVRLTGSTAEILIDSAQTSAQITRTALTVSEIRLGGMSGFIDEFMFRDNLSGSEIPDEPEQGYVTLSEIGGTGSGKLGSVTLTASRTLNSCAGVLSWPDAQTCKVGTVYAGNFGSFSAGEEVMILKHGPDNPGYAFRTISAVSGSTVTLDSPVTEFALSSDSKTQLIQIPHFGSLTVHSGVTISPLKWNGQAGGVIAFRVKNDCTISGSLLTHGLGTHRLDSLQLSHGRLIDNFLPDCGGGVFIVCGGKLTLNSGARVGASWDGSLKGGSAVHSTSQSLSGNPGGAGYGGSGGVYYQSGITYSGTTKRAGAGQAGAGGGALSVTLQTYGQTGSEGTSTDVQTGFPYWYQGSGHSIYNGWAYHSSGAGISSRYTSCGAFVVLIAKTLRADMSAVSTGGAGGTLASQYAGGGGGTGFCYIACEELEG